MQIPPRSRPRAMTPKPKCRWFQFSLKTMLIGVFVVSVPLPSFGGRRQAVYVRGIPINTARGACHEW